MYQPNYGYQYPYYGAQPPMPDNLAQLRMNTNQMQNAVVQPSMPSQPMQVQQPNNGLIWVQGEAAAKSYPVTPNCTVMLLDSENSAFYLKSADSSGMPLPLRIFDYKERTNSLSQAAASPTIQENINLDNFVTRKEFEERMASITSQNNSRLTKDSTESV